MRWGENNPGNPETFSARMHIEHKEERRYGRGQCHDHVDIIPCICTSNERAWVFRVHGVLFSEIDITQPYYRGLHVPAPTLVEEIFLTALHHRVRINESRRDKKREIGRSMEGMGNARDCMSLVRAINGVSRDQTPRYRLIRRYTTVRR